MDKDYLTIKEAAKMLGVSSSTLRRLEKDGVVEGYGLHVYYTPGGQRRYYYNEVEYAYKKWGVSKKVGFGAKPCIIVRDLIRAFTDESSKAGYDLSEVIEQTRILLEQAKEEQIPVIFAITFYEPGNRYSEIWAKKIESNQLLIKDSVWTEIDPRLSSFAFEEVMFSPYVSPFFRSQLADWIEEHEIDTAIVAGNSTSGCVRVTVIDALQHGLRPIIAKETVGDRSPLINETALLELDAKYADVVSMEEVLRYFASLRK
ncbi:isochorismatase family protein [Ammoniphilus sp. YIM 78166]|uniref:isochorismatase family protein n=1 Tax=Ammoniphilus sp. YIM 78166 TaxID=1644106 RepID=UPI00106F1EF8|nr:isochorismatase family protein [Ammoniphilus sp. YIM 78166]